jgi:formylglycine-generating enzyme required for sulfatase activity
MPEKKCLSCGEPLKDTWKICPVCETPINAMFCPQCSQPVQNNWKRCPACEAILVCADCRRRIPKGKRQCPNCRTDEKTKAGPVREIQEKICGIRLVFVPGGEFAMGDSAGEGGENEKPAHQVELDDFYLGQYLISQKQWLRLMPDNPSRFDDPDCPVEQVSWYHVQDFIKLLNNAHKGKYIFSLPSEAQWEFAARSGGRQERYAGSGEIESVAWYEDNSQGRTHAVGTKRPNDLGLYDMSGNVWEWCQDSFWQDAYSRHNGRNPLIERPAEDRVIRGGSWNLDAWSARCTRRFNFKADFFGPALGFRLAMKASA